MKVIFVVFAIFISLSASAEPRKTVKDNNTVRKEKICCVEPSGNKFAAEKICNPWRFVDNQEVSHWRCEQDSNVCPKKSRKVGSCNKDSKIIFPNRYVEAHPQRVAGFLACPEGYAMAGAHVDSGYLLCQKTLPHVETKGDNCPGACSQKEGMHVCPEGWFMRGHSGKSGNNLLCARTRSGFSRGGKDGTGGNPTQEYGMHACPSGKVMFGIHKTNNEFYCGNVR